MENIKKLGSLIDKATSDAHDRIPEPLQQEILILINSRADMPKHAINSISKRMALKNKKVLLNIFSLLEFLAYNCELSLYSQISTKDFLFKISGILMNKDVDPAVKEKILQTIFCWEELFRPHEDLLTLFFQFYAGVLRNNYEIPHDYVSPFRPAKLKEYKKREQASKPNLFKQERKVNSEIAKPSLSEQQTFEQIREKLILTNEIIDNASPQDNVKENALLLEMIEQIRDCEKRVNKTINENPSENIMELALAANDDIFITYRRFKDLQRNRKPEPFMLAELASDSIKEQEARAYRQKQEAHYVKKEEKKEQRKPAVVDILGMDDEPVPRPAPIKKEESLFDMDFEPEQKKPVPQTQPQGDIFDLLGDDAPSKPQPYSQPFPPSYSQPYSQPAQNNLYDDLLGSHSVPQPSGYGISLNTDDFKTDADMKPYDNRSAMDKLDDLTSQWIKK